MENQKVGWKTSGILVTCLAYGLLGLGGIIIGPNCIFAQTTVPDSIVQITAEAQGLQLMPPEQLPFVGTFWLLTPGGRNRCLTVPLPTTPIPSLPTYPIADGQFIVDGTAGQAASQDTLEAEANAVLRLINQVQGAQVATQLGRGIAMGSTNSQKGGLTNNYNINTNLLWLQMITVTNQAASMVIHPPWKLTNEVYDLLYSTNFASHSWQWLLRSFPRQTNVIAPNASGARGFYKLGSPNDLAANDSLGTNFWVAFYSVYSDGNNLLSLAISSPLGATGTVVTPGMPTNGPIAVVTNCGDAALNGTYVRTNLTAQERSDWENNDTPSGSASYVHGTNWLIVVPPYCEFDAYDSARQVLTTLYLLPGANLNGTPNEWQDFNDTNSAPATLCGQVPIVNQFFSVAPGAVTNIALPLGVMMPNVADQDVLETNGIQITTTQVVAVYGLNYDQAASAAFTAYPTTLLGTNYCVMARAAWASSQQSKLAILATENNTTVWITPSPAADLVNYPGTNVYQVNLQAGETYQNRSMFSFSDVTGTWITSDKPIAVFAGANQANVPDENTQSGNPLVQEQLPVESWGKEVLALSFAGRTNGDSYRVLAAYDNTVITITGRVVTITNEPDDGVTPWVVTTTNGVRVVTNQAGQYYDLILDGPAEFQASQPIQVAQFANGCFADCFYRDRNDQFPQGDPCGVLLPPVGHYLSTNIIVALPNDGVSGDFDTNFLNLIVAQSALTNIMVNGMPVAATNFVVIGASGYVGAQIPVANGVQKVTCSQPIAVEIYGFGQADAYGYFGGIVK